MSEKSTGIFIVVLLAVLMVWSMISSCGVQQRPRIIKTVSNSKTCEPRFEIKTICKQRCGEKEICEVFKYKITCEE